MIVCDRVLLFFFHQVKEAEDYLKQANKMLTKTITRWNPDFFSAAPLFEKVCVGVLEQTVMHAQELNQARPP